MTLRALALTLVVFGAPGIASAFVPALPSGAEALATVDDGSGRFAIATSGAALGTPPEQITRDADRQRRSWRIPADVTTVPEVLDLLREKLTSDGAEILFDCAADVCGGYDFRIDRDILPLPDMFVDLGRYWYISARLSEGAEDDTLLEAIVSDTGEWVYLQTAEITRADPEREDADPAQVETAPGRVQSVPLDATDVTAVEQALSINGHIALEGLEFASGTAELTNAPSSALAALAAYLLADEARRVALVGHSDWQGSRDANRRLSLARAQAILSELSRAYDVPKAQMSAHGIGDLAPRTTNLTEEGRLSNRRVDVVAQPSPAR